MQQLVLGNPDLAFLPYRISMNELRALALHLCDVVARETGARSVREIGFPGSAASPDAFVIDGKTYTVGALTYYRRYAYLTQFVDFDALESIVELGSGDGRQAEVIKQFHPHLTYYMVDIPPVLYVGSQCMEARFRAAFVPFAAGNAGEAMVLPDGAIAPFGNWQMERLRPQGRTLFLSCASLGEMHRNAVANYLKIAAGVADVVYLMQVMHGRRSAGASFVASDDVIGFDDYVAGLGPEFALIDRSPAIDVFGPERDDFTYENAVWQRLTPRAAGASRAPG